MIKEKIKSVKKVKGFIDDKFNGYKITLQDDSIWQAPLVEGNRHYDAVIEWEKDGNTIEEAD